GILKNPQGCIVIPDDRSLKVMLLMEVHDAPTSGHLGIEKTLARLGKIFWWPGMRQEVQEYINSCVACQSNKASNRSPAGLLHSLPIPAYNWEQVSMDFVGPLPATERGKDNIMVVVDKLSKMVHLIPCRTTITAPQVANLFFREVVRHHGLPTAIISDRDPRFTSHFWGELWRLLGTKLKMSSSYHPQTDGQTERVNRVMEEILRSYVKDTGDDWDEHLTTVEIAINTSKHTSTEASPFKLNYGREMVLPIEQAVSKLMSSNNPSAADSIRRMNEDLDTAKKNISKAQERQAYYADKSRRVADIYKVGDRVMLSTENLTHKAGKLSGKFTGPFTIIEVHEDKTVKLELPTMMKAKYDRFHVSKVKPFHMAKIDFPDRQQLDRPPPIIVSDQEEYEVEEILAKRELRARRGQTKLQYLVKWKGYPATEATWSSLEDLANAIETVNEFEKTQ
ncbi:MAG TPA: DDE-type integrase/transposase/recombinase, partial [Candidatus Babeliaceae bacterium]|nr:DDE-type integrase/transposase/recombinase [Candidatus Babeliaceae bacterium]